MTSVNVVSSPAVNGNIGSCTTEVTDTQVSRDGFWTGTWKSIATNSCTGQTETHLYWQITNDAGWVLLPAAIIVIILAFGLAINIASDW